MNVNNEALNDGDKLNNSSMILMSQGTMGGVKSDSSVIKNPIHNYESNLERD